MWVLIFQRLALDTLLHILYFPVWWYTAGARRVIVGLWHLLQDANAMFAPGLWLRNIFVPMFGQTDWQGRITSVFIRFLNVIFRTVILMIWSWVLVVLFFAWVAFPLFVLFMLFL